MTQRITLKDYLSQNVALLQEQGKDADALNTLMLGIADACVDIADLVRHGELAGVLGAAGQENVQGEEQKKLDIIANDVFIEKTQDTGQLAGIASEEMDHHYPIPDGVEKGKYLITVDPLDGSSNIDVNGATGTIFSVLPHMSEDAPTDADFLQSGEQQVLAGYCLFSSATMLVITFGNGVAGFTLDIEQGEFLLSHENMTVPKTTKEFSINAAYAAHWHAPVKRYIDECVQGEQGPRDANFNMRWAGSMVGDVHRILCRGGVFLYPSDERMQKAGKAGKLRLMYEANPMAWLMEQAGGLAHTGAQSILSVDPTELHQRVPVMMGSADEVERLIDYHTSAS